jgi:hypothetical protein
MQVHSQQCLTLSASWCTVNNLGALQGLVQWSDILLSKLSSTVKLVGATINCQGAPFQGDPKQHWRKNPHVQSYLVATDQIGLKLIMQDKNVFRCYKNIADTIYHSELGSTKAILAAGYNIDSLMVRPFTE